MAHQPDQMAFRKVEGERSYDALAYCPVCRSSEVRIDRAYTQQWNIISHVDEHGVHASAVPNNRPMTSLEHNHSSPWQFVLRMSCGNGHVFRLSFQTHKALTWAEVDYPGKRGSLCPKPPNHK